MPRPRPTFLLMVCAMVLSPGAAAAQGAMGRIEGTAAISARIANPRQRVRVYAEPGVAAAAPAADTNRFINVVLYLESAPALRSAARAGTTAVMRQRGEQFAPHVLAVPTGTTVEFPNEDPIYHNVFSLSRARTFDLGRYARGNSKSVRFAAPGVVQVFCHIHADMSGYVLVFDHPYFVQPGADGRFVLEGVPPGEYELVAWHERVRPIRTPVRVEAGGTVRLNVSIPIEDRP